MRQWRGEGGGGQGGGERGGEDEEGSRGKEDNINANSTAATLKLLT